MAVQRSIHRLPPAPGPTQGGPAGPARSRALARSAFGADRFDSGRIMLDGKEITVRSPRDAIRQGIFMVPESRKEQGREIAHGA